MVFQVLSGFRKNPDNIEQRGMFELLEIRRLQQFHFQDKILVELVRRQIIHQEKLVGHPKKGVPLSFQMTCKQNGYNPYH